MRREALGPAYLPLLESCGLPGELGGQARLLHFARGEAACRQGETLDYLMLITAGRAKACVTFGDGRTLLLSFYRRGEVLGDVELLTGRGEAAATVEVLAAMTCVGIPRKNCLEWLERYPAFARRLGAGVAEKLLDSSLYSAQNLLFPLEQRLCSYVAMAEENGRFRENLMDLADLFGVSYRHLTRTLRALCDAGVLRREGGSLFIEDRSALEERMGCFRE